MSTETTKEKEPATNVEATQTHLFTRQPLSVFGKIAFWASVVGGLGSLGGTIALTIASGSPSRDIVITTVCWLAIAVILATRFRWAPLVSTLLGGYNLYLICTQPYVIESLANPKGPNGGFAHFAGTTYTNGVPTVHMGAGNFLQSSVTIPKGSKLLLVDDVASLHILANGSWQNGVARSANEPGAPQVNNVQVNGSSIEIGPFNIAGTYHIYCEVHQGMNLTIIVQ